MSEQTKTKLENTWDSIVKMVDAMVTETDAGSLGSKYGHDLSSVDKTQKVHVIEPSSRQEVENLNKATLNLLEDIISLMFFGKDLYTQELKSESNFLAKLSARLHRVVTLSLDAPMAVGMKENDRKVYLLLNPVRLRYTVSTVGEVIAIVRHELYHILYQHLPESKQYPMDSVTQYVLNIAQDCEINQSNLIKDELPDGAITLDYVRKESGDMTLKELAGYEVYYKALTKSKSFMDKVKEQQRQSKSKVFNSNPEDDNNNGSHSPEEQGFNKGGETSIGEGDSNLTGSKVGLDELVGEASHGSWGGQEVSQDTAEKMIGGIVKETYNNLSDKERGLLSKRFKGQISKLEHEPEVDWRDQIKRQHGRMKSRNKRKTLARPNRRYPNRLDLKGKLPDYDINIVMALDVSGSVSDNALGYTMGEGYHLSRELDAPLTLLQIDSELVSVQKVEKPTDFNLVDIKARGGTRFQPAFDYLEENKLTDKNTMLVYVTDGYGESESELKRHGFNNVLWILVDTNNPDVLSCDGKGRVELLNNDKGFNS